MLNQSNDMVARHNARKPEDVIVSDHLIETQTQ